MIGNSDRFKDLYILDAKCMATNVVINESYLPLNHVSIPVNSVLANIWHNILGHLSFKQLNTLKSQLNCDASKCNNDQPCYICPLAKHIRLPFVSHNHLSKSPFDLIHCVIWGPYHVSVVFGYSYFLTIMDDYTHFT